MRRGRDRNVESFSCLIADALPLAQFGDWLLARECEIREHECANPRESFPADLFEGEQFRYRMGSHESSDFGSR